MEVGAARRKASLAGATKRKNTNGKASNSAIGAPSENLGPILFVKRPRSVRTPAQAELKRPGQVLSRAWKPSAKSLCCDMKRPNVGGQRSQVREGQGFDAPLGLDFLFLIIFVKAVA